VNPLRPHSQGADSPEEFFIDIWDNGGREMAQEIIRKSKNGIHDARKVAETAEKSADAEVQIGID
jgi:hypothetical protein